MECQFHKLTPRPLNNIQGGKVEAVAMPSKQILDKLSIYIPEKKILQKPIERLIKLGEKRDRSVNYLVVQAIPGYLKREEA